MLTETVDPFSQISKSARHRLFKLIFVRFQMTGGDNKLSYHRVTPNFLVLIILQSQVHAGKRPAGKIVCRF